MIFHQLPVFTALWRFRPTRRAILARLSWLERYRRFYEASFDSLDEYLQQIQNPETFSHERGQPSVPPDVAQ